MGFQFPLAAVLQVRIRAEEREEALLKQILAELAKASVTMQEIEVAIASAHRDRVSEAGASITALDICAQYGAIEILDRRRAAVMEHVQKVEQLRDKQMAAYGAARRNRETLDQLLNEQRAAYESSVAQREQREMNDIAVRRHVRQKSAADSRTTKRR